METVIIVLAGCFVCVCALFWIHVRGEAVRLAASHRDALETLKATNLKEKVEVENIRAEFKLHAKQLEEAYRAEMRDAKRRATQPPEFAMTEDGRQIELSRLEPVSPSEVKEWES